MIKWFLTKWYKHSPDCVCGYRMKPVDTYGDTYRGILLGDYAVLKAAKGIKLTRDRKMNTPTISSDKTGGAF